MIIRNSAKMIGDTVLQIHSALVIVNAAFSIRPNVRRSISVFVMVMWAKVAKNKIRSVFNSRPRVVYTMVSAMGQELAKLQVAWVV